MEEHVRNIAVCIILSLVTCGIYNVYWQYKQMESVNDMLHEERIGSEATLQTTRGGEPREVRITIGAM